MATIDNLTLELNADSTKAIKAIDALSQSMNSLKVNMPKQSAFNGTVKGLQSLRTELSKISTSAKGLEKIKALGDIAKGLSKIGENTISAKKLQGTANGLSAISTSINSITYEGINKIERLSDALRKIPTPFSSVRSVINSASRVSQSKPLSATTSTARTSEVTDVASTAGEVSKATGGLEKAVALFGVLKTVISKVQPVIKVITTAFSFLSKVLDKLISPLKNLVNGIRGFLKSLGRIAFYRFIRGILKGISQGLQEGIQNLALYSKAMNELDTHSANHVMSRYASEFLYFKNAVATAVIPVLRAMIPLVEQAINKVIDFINVLAQIGSAFFGGTFTKAKYFWVDYADSLDKANGRAKALHHQLAGFDELNNLTAPSGGSGSADLLDPSKMFEEANISGKILEKVEKIKEAFEKLKKLGQDILAIVSPIKDKGKELTEWFEKVWERISPNVEKVWELIKKIWDKLAEPLAEGFVKGFLDGFVGTFTDEDKIEKIGRFSDMIGNLADAISKLLDKLDTEKVKDFGEVLGRIAGVSFRNLPLTILGMVFPLANVILHFVQLNNLLKSNAENIQKVGDKLEELKEKLTDFVTSIIQLLVDWQTVCWDLGLAIGKAIGEFLRTGDIKTAWNKLTENLKQIFNTAKEVIGGDLDAIKQKILDLVRDIPIIGVIVDFFSDNPSSKNYNPARASLGKGYNSSRATLSGYASGGFPVQGDLFIANERGAEMVGSIGNQTAVANNDQITQAIATATYNAMSKALSENNGNVTFVVEGDGDQMYKIWQKKNREYERKTGLAY